jgi:predicted secreted protein
MSYGAEMIDMSIKTDFPYKKSKPGWEGPVTIDCDGLLMAGGTGGIASLINTIKARTLVAIAVTIGDSGEELTGNAWMTNVELDAPQDKEATMSCKLTVEGELTATEGA